MSMNIPSSNTAATNIRQGVDSFVQGQTKAVDSDKNKLFSVSNLPQPLFKEAKDNIGKQVANGVYLGFCVVCPPYVAIAACSNALKKGICEYKKGVDLEKSFKKHDLQTRKDELVKVKDSQVNDFTNNYWRPQTPGREALENKMKQTAADLKSVDKKLDKLKNYEAKDFKTELDKMAPPKLEGRALEKEIEIKEDRIGVLQRDVKFFQEFIKAQEDFHPPKDQEAAHQETIKSLHTQLNEGLSAIATLQMLVDNMKKDRKQMKK